jgi:hypothetical protein
MMTEAEMDAVATEIVRLVADVALPLRERVAALEKELTELKTRPLLKWQGVHAPGRHYQEGSLTTKAGSLWIATSPTTSTPGEAGSAWRLIVKRGESR